KKSMFKTSGGKYIAPQLIENAMKQSSFIEHILVVGEGEKMPAALIQPNWEYINDWIEIKQNGISKQPEEAVKDEKLLKRIQEEIDLYNEPMGSWEKIKTFALTPDVWSIEGGQLTPTMKAKRKVIKEMYKHLYEGLYGRSQ
ncbi:MAG: long-chain fatty acid--CoA ligase, partial [Marinirhabdus sp.]